MRGSIPDEKCGQIDKTIPSIDSRLFLATVPGMIIGMHDLLNEAKLGVAIECLNDAQKRFFLVQSALFEAQACLIWYREVVPSAPLDFQAVMACKFYLDYVTLLLYATAEDISFFILYFLDLEESLRAFLEELTTKRQITKKRIFSNAGKVGFFLANRKSDHPLTSTIMQLHRNRDWKMALDYRNTWVHDKPPIVAGLGIEFSRHKHLVIGDDGRKWLAIGGGTDPQFTIEQLLATVLSATQALADALSQITTIVIEEREGIGEVFDFEAGTVGMRQRGEIKG